MNDEMKGHIVLYTKNLQLDLREKLTDRQWAAPYVDILTFIANLREPSANKEGEQ